MPETIVLYCVIIACFAICMTNSIILSSLFDKSVKESETWESCI